MTLDDQDRQCIAEAMAEGGKIWENDKIKALKDKIKAHYRGETGGHCCYCLASFRGGFKYDIDIEHVLPKSKFIDFIFEIFNLNISCKRCNMKIKQERIDFLVNAPTVHLNAMDSAEYLFIHPNFDNYYEHLDHFVVIKNAEELVKFVPKKPKGAFTYDFFRLAEMEVDSINRAQGIKDPAELFLADQSADVQAIANGLIEQLKER
jgi:hypothetical protein